MTDSKKVVYAKEIIKDYYDIFVHRNDRLVAFLETYGPNIVIEQEKELIIKSLDDLIKAASGVKEFIFSVEGATEKETKEYLAKEKK